VPESRVARERDLDRFLTFIDAMVAIAITLLVLPLAEAATEVGAGSVGDLLRENDDKLLAFFLSFLVIAQLWMSQHHIVSGLVVQNTGVTRLLLAWTLTIVFLPFPTALVAEVSDDPATKVLYIGTMAMSSTLLALLAWAIGRDRSLRDTDVRPDQAQAAGAVVGFVLALAITLTFPATGYYPLFLLLLADPAVSAWRRARGGGKRRAHMGE
jgi:TMEM175 potassium channel family protein